MPIHYQDNKNGEIILMCKMKTILLLGYLPMIKITLLIESMIS